MTQTNLKRQSATDCLHKYVKSKVYTVTQDRRTCISIDTIVSFKNYESFLWARVTDRGSRKRGRRGGQCGGKTGGAETPRCGLDGELRSSNEGGEFHEHTFRCHIKP